jgi:HEAT repeat protein
MRASTYIIGLAALGIVAAGIGVARVLREREVVPEYVAARGLEQPVQAVGAADARLTEQVSGRLGLSRPKEPEIDLSNPTEADIRFLIETFDGKEPGGRRSAARALVAIQEPRAVGLLVRAGGTPEERAYYCAGALEILRFKTREQAAGLMIDVLEDTSASIEPSCRSEIQQKLKFIGGETPEVLGVLLDSDRPRVRRFALAHLSPSGDGETRRRVEALKSDRDAGVAELARRWLSIIPPQQSSFMGEASDASARPQLPSP